MYVSITSLLPVKKKAKKEKNTWHVPGSDMRSKENLTPVSLKKQHGLFFCSLYSESFNFS